MIGSILMLGSTFGKSRRVNIICIVSWLAFMLLGSNLQSGISYIVFNLISFGAVVLLGKVFKGKISNTVVSVGSILIWSIIMDVLCYLFFPQLTFGQGLISYVMSGMLFNAKFCFMNCLIVGIGYFVNYLLKAKKCGNLIAVKVRN